MPSERRDPARIGHAMRAAACALVLLAGALGVAGPARAQDEIRIAGGREGTPWNAFAERLAELLHTALPDTDVEVLRRANGYWNPIIVNSRRADFGLSYVATASWAYRGNKLAYPPHHKKYTEIRAVLGGLGSVWFTAMLREDYIHRTGYYSLDQALVAEHGEPRIVMEPPSSTVPFVADMMLAAMGTSRENLRAHGGDVLQVGAKQIPSMLRDGRADLYLEAAVAADPTVTESSLTGNVRFVDLPSRAISALAHDGLVPKLLPRRFKGQDGPVNALDLGTMIIAHRDVPNEVVYTLAKIVADRGAELTAGDPAWRDFKPQHRWDVAATGIPLHPGALKLYRERGWLGPAKNSR